uniref:Uncharacterized protein n=1 Tax=Oryza punctata TaxID=4537 RepID=A0A0E0LWC9_ORYPU
MAESKKRGIRDWIGDSQRKRNRKPGRLFFLLSLSSRAPRLRLRGRETDGGRRGFASGCGRGGAAARNELRRGEKVEALIGRIPQNYGPKEDHIWAEIVIIYVLELP